jgi:hypothetical protein
MFCPRCGSTHSDELKFCKVCGANLSAVRTAVESPDTSGKFNWSNTWVADMLLSGDEAVKKAAKIERIQGITPEIKRRNEIKAGVITSSVGIGLMILLFFFMPGIILSGKVELGVAEILRRVWIAGVIPLFVGIALIINGTFISKTRDELIGRESDPETRQLDASPASEYLPPVDTNELFPAGFSVTDETTRHLDKEPAERKAQKPN